MIVLVALAVFFAVPYYGTTLLFAKVSDWEWGVAAEEEDSNANTIFLIPVVDVKVGIRNYGYVDVTLRSVRATLKIDDKNFSDLVPLGLPSEMVSEVGFVLRANSSREYTITFLRVDADLRIVGSMNLTLTGEASCLWYTRSFTIEAVVI